MIFVLLVGGFVASWGTMSGSGVSEVESVSRGRLEAVIELSVPLWLFWLKRWWWWWWEPLGLFGVVCFASRGRRGWDPFWVGRMSLVLLFRLQVFVSGPGSLRLDKMREALG